MTGFIYKHTNTVTGKSYIGQTTQKPESRWGKDGCNYKSNRQLYRDILEYGWDSFTHEVIEEVKAKSKVGLKEKLDVAENKYILKYKTMLPEYGYNTVVSTKNFNLRLSNSAKRFISHKVKQGVSFEESYVLYKNTRRK